MVEIIAEDKNKILEYMGKSLEKYGPDKMNVDEIGKLADAIKDMAEAEKACWEAEYYRSVTEAMDGQGYTPDMMGYQGQGGNRGRMGYNRNRDSMGRYTSGRRGYHEGMDGLRAEMQSASPEEREKMKRELRQMLDM
jgi:hypothetical protein